MKTVLAEHKTVIPKGVTVKIVARKVWVEGPRGKLYREFKHINVDMEVRNVDGKDVVWTEIWHSSSKGKSVLRTINSHISNMMTGVTAGFRYKMRFVYAHFPINALITKDALEIRNFLGEKIVRRIPLPEGVVVKKCEKVKDQLLFEGSNIEDVSRTCALTHQSCLVKNKDIRKFLDGIYTSERGLMTDPL